MSAREYMMVRTVRLVVELPPRPWWRVVWDWIRWPGLTRLDRMTQGALFRLFVKGKPVLVLPLDLFDQAEGTLLWRLGSPIELGMTDTFRVGLEFGKGRGPRAGAPMTVYLDGEIHGRAMSRGQGVSTRAPA